MAINFSDTTPAAPSGGSNIKWQNDSGGNVSAYISAAVVAAVSPIVIGFVISSGATGTNVGPMLVAARSGSVSKCVVVTKASDSSTALTFTIKKNGTTVFSSSPTIAAGTASGTVSTFTGLAASPPPLAVAANDVFSIDITSGTGTWQFTAQLE